MAIDTTQKRLSSLNFSWVPGVTLPDADGTVDAGDKSHMLHLYSGIEIGITKECDLFRTAVTDVTMLRATPGTDSDVLTMPGTDDSGLRPLPDTDDDFLTQPTASDPDNLRPDNTGC